LCSTKSIHMNKSSKWWSNITWAWLRRNYEPYKHIFKLLWFSVK
jgi:hypothetical protein